MKSRRGVQIFCAEFLVNPGPIDTMTYDEGTESFQVREVQLVENSDASAPKRMKLQQRYLEKVGNTPSCTSVEPFSVEIKQSPLVTVPNVVFVWKLR